MDSAVLIRTADTDLAGRMRIGVGSTLVRHFDPDSEVAETKAKAASLLSALEPCEPVRFGEHPDAALHAASRPAQGDVKALPRGRHGR